MRFARAVLTSLCLLLVIATIGLFPSYVSKKGVTNDLLKERKEADEKNTQTSLAAADAVVKNNKALAGYVETRIKQIEKEPVASTLIGKVFNKAGGTISIAGINLSGGVLTLQGSATTRAELISFHQRLKEVSEFKDAVLPIADVAKGVNPDFSIQITLSS